MDHHSSIRSKKGHSLQGSATDHSRPKIPSASGGQTLNLSTIPGGSRRTGIPNPHKPIYPAAQEPSHEPQSEECPLMNVAAENDVRGPLGKIIEAIHRACPKKEPGRGWASMTSSPQASRIFPPEISRDKSEIEYLKRIAKEQREKAKKQHDIGDKDSKSSVTHSRV